MPKSATILNGPQPIVASGKVTLVNCSSSPVFLTNDEIDTALDPLPYPEKMTVLNALYAIQPGASKSLATATYNLSFSMSFNNSVVLFQE